MFSLQQSAAHLHGFIIPTTQRLIKKKATGQCARYDCMTLIYYSLVALLKYAHK